MFDVFMSHARSMARQAGKVAGAPLSLGYVLVAGLGVIAVRLVTLKLGAQPLFIDFLTMWTGGRMADSAPSRLYDVAAINQAQAWLLGPAVHGRPFPYPPSTLLIFGPLGRLPFWTASAVWMIATVAAFGLFAVRLPRRRHLLGAAMIALMPAVVWAAISGQCVFLIGALAIPAIAVLERKPLLAGALLGIAAAFKPTVLLMAPVALVAGGHWRALIGAGAAGLSVAALSVVAYGPAPWIAWVVMSPGYLKQITSDPQFFTGIVAPAGLAAQLGLEGWALILWRSGFAAAGVVMAVLVFRRTPRLCPRLTALFGASLLVSPYAMNYETALLAPGAVLALMTAADRPAQRFALAALVALAAAGIPVICLPALIVFLVLSLGPALARTWRAGAAITPALPG